MKPPAAPQLRPETADDEAFLLHLYGTTRAWELAQVPWDEAQKAAFVQSQFELQRTHYRRYYAGASFDIVVAGGERAGRLYVLRQPHDIRIIDLAVLPEWRGQGLGSALLSALAGEGRQSRRPVSLHVETHNPARRLYERHGFVLQDEKGPYVLLVRPWEAGENEPA
ncbi:MAG: GNAT family N-acetyltransferase [Bryobacterales bacterium]|nr:GNAT family N-acetyltransferase [Bryobacterales bacterium]